MKRPCILFATLLAILYLLLAAAVHYGLLRTFDRDTLLFLQAWLPRSVDLPFSVLSLLGSFEVTLVVLLVILLYFIQPRYRPLLLILFLLIVPIEWLGKTFLDQTGPHQSLHRYVLPFGFPTGRFSTRYSFPSGHAARSAFLMVLGLVLIQRGTWQLAAKRLFAVLLLIAEGVMLVSRVYLAEHWTADVLAGLLLGVLFALPALRADAVREQSLGQRARDVGVSPPDAVRGAK